MFFVAQYSVETLLLPQIVFSPQFAIHKSRRHTFDRTDQFFQFVTVKRSHNQVAMVGHDHITCDMIPLILEMEYRTCKFRREFGFLKVTVAATLIEPFINSIRDRASVFLPCFVGTWMWKLSFPFTTH